VADTSAEDLHRSQSMRSVARGVTQETNLSSRRSQSAYLSGMKPQARTHVTFFCLKSRC
jgi:hypothetical protein